MASPATGSDSSAHRVDDRPSCPNHGPKSMLEMESVGAPGWFVCAASDFPGGPTCGKSAARKVKHGGWPTAFHAEKSSTHCRPIVPGATFSVRCPCGFAHDSAAPTADAALADMRTRHDCGSPFMVAEPVVDLPDAESADARIARLEALVQSLATTVEKLRFENIVKGALPDDAAPDDGDA